MIKLTEAETLVSPVKVDPTPQSLDQSHPLTFQIKECWPHNLMDPLIPDRGAQMTPSIRGLWVNDKRGVQYKLF